MKQKRSIERFCIYAIRVDYLPFSALSRVLILWRRRLTAVFFVQLLWFA